MSGKDLGGSIFLAGLTVVLIGSVAYGLLTGEIPTLGGTGRYEADILWQSREDEPRLFWFAVSYHLVIAVGAAVLGMRIAGDEE